MKRILPLLFLCTLFIAVAAHAQQKVYVFRHANVLPMNKDTMLSDQRITVTGTTITSVTPESTAPLPKDAIEIDATNKFIVPGFSDMHGHLPAGTEDDEFTLKQYLYFQVNAGVTHTRSMRSQNNQQAAVDSIKTGAWLGPDLYLCKVAPLSDTAFHGKKMELFVTDAKKAGYKMIKYLNGGSEKQINELVSVCGKHNMPLGGHVPKNDITWSAQHHWASVEHFTYLLSTWKKDSTLVGPILDSMAKYKVFFCPTVSCYYNNDHMPNPNEAMKIQGMSVLPRDQVDAWMKDYRDTLRKMRKDSVAFRNYRMKKRLDYQRAGMIIQMAKQRGVMIITSADEGLLTVPGYSLQQEMEFYQNVAQLTPYEILRSVTWNAAAFRGDLDRYGSIEKGKAADFVMLTFNPLLGIRTVEYQDGVFCNGRWHTQKELLEYIRNFKNER